MLDSSPDIIEPRKARAMPIATIDCLLTREERRTFLTHTSKRGYNANSSEW